MNGYIQPSGATHVGKHSQKAKGTKPNKTQALEGAKSLSHSVRLAMPRWQSRTRGVDYLPRQACSCNVDSELKSL
eukprot:434796-Amphidinium_carterae.1